MESHVGVGGGCYMCMCFYIHTQFLQSEFVYIFSFIYFFMYLHFFLWYTFAVYKICFHDILLASCK